MRTESYRDFMYRNPEVFRDKVRPAEQMQTDVCVNVCIQYAQGSWFNVKPSLLTEIGVCVLKERTLIR